MGTPGKAIVFCRQAVADRPWPDYLKFAAKIALASEMEKRSDRGAQGASPEDPMQGI